MKKVRPKYLPNIPGISDFLELNMRTYVHDRNGSTGIWFYSLDASQILAVELAKRLFNLPYFYANMKAEKNELTREIYFSSRRYETDLKYKSNFRYRTDSHISYAESDSLEFFLTERYIMFIFSKKNNYLYKGRIYHKPHPLIETELIEWDYNIFEVNNFRDQIRNRIMLFFQKVLV